MDKKISEESRDSAVARVDSRVTESKLVEAARNGDQRAFGRLVRDHQKRLFRFIYGLTGSFDQTEDIVQEAFVKAYQALDSFKPEADFYPWLATIARNLAFNQIKREQKKESLDEARERGFDQASGDLGPLEQLIGSEGQRRFYEALQALPESYRTVFVLRHLEEMDYKEIAAQLKIPPGTVDSRLYRARQLLLEALKDML